MAKILPKNQRFILYFKGNIRTTCILDTESKSHYWLTICAQDQAVVPLYSCIEVSLIARYCENLTIDDTDIISHIQIRM